jgi:hypothetical protein
MLGTGRTGSLGLFDKSNNYNTSTCVVAQFIGLSVIISKAPDKSPKSLALREQAGNYKAGRLR